MYYPLAINLAHKNVVIIGGGVIATQKLRTLQGYGADITVVAPTLTSEAAVLLNEVQGKWLQQSFEPQHVQNAFVVFIATNNKAVNESVSAAVVANQLVLRADDVSQGNMLNQAVVRRGALSIAVCTEGASPSLTRKLKKDFEAQFPLAYAHYVEFLAQARQQIVIEVASELRRELLQRLVDDRLKELILTNQQQQAEAIVAQWIAELQ